ncbi:MAG: hypothetical protein D3911_11945 [Candidatus Electrothrix sp. AW3_4]|nr:hypothetical protein [Candidatus Electrothrix gigas]
MKLNVLTRVTVLLLLSAGVAFAGGRVMTCDDCTDACLENPYSKGCPPVCKDPECRVSCDDCSFRCRQNPYDIDCPDICRDVTCQSCEDCTEDCKINPYGNGCPDICRDIKCYSCDDCSVECIENPEGQDCPPVCDELGCNICDKFPLDCPASCKKGSYNQEDCPTACQDIPEECLSEEIDIPIPEEYPIDPITPEEPEEDPITPEDYPVIPEEDPILPKDISCDDCPPECRKLDCPDDDFIPTQQPISKPTQQPKPTSTVRSLRFIGDLGYLRLGDPADFLFARLGVQYSPYTRARYAGTPYENISYLLMIGSAPKLSDDNEPGASALLLDGIAQYNFSDSFDGFVGIGLGAWISAGDDDIETEDSDLDILLNVGARVYGEPDKFNASVFLEARNAVDELGDISNCGRFGIGLRFQY